MKLELGKRADYSVRAVLYLAMHSGDRRQKARTIATSVSIPEKYLPQVMAPLVRAGIVDSGSGRDGGYILTRDPADVTLLQVIEASEGPIQSTECVLRGGVCRRDDKCAVHNTWLEAQNALRQRLATTNFSQLADIESASWARD